jgi:hypothetical protein
MPVKSLDDAFKSAEESGKSQYASFLIANIDKIALDHIKTIKKGK